MSRKLKNIIMGVLVVLLIITTCFTVYSASNNGNNGGMNVQENTGTPPQMLSGEMNNNSNIGQPPEKPEGESGAAFDMDSNESPELPDNAGGGGMMNGPGGNEMANMDPQNASSHVSVLYYVLLTIQGLGLAALIIYLIMSGFNRKSFKATFCSRDKIIIYVLAILLIAESLTLIEINLTKNAFKSADGNNQMMEFGMNEGNAEISYSAVKEITEDTEFTGGEYASSKPDENAILASGDIDAVIENAHVEKTGDSDGGDNTSFYGMNSAILAKSGTDLNLKNITVTTDAAGANGVFSYGGSAKTNNNSSDGTTINISDSTITTRKDNSGGIMTTGGGITNAYDLTVTTAGVSSAAIRTDRGGGTVNVEGGTYTTTGSGSPAVYSTAEIAVKNATLVTKAAEGIVIEGKNSVLIDNCDLTSSNTKLNGLSTTYKNIFLYQSMSGDADNGNSSFTATDSRIKTNNGDTFYITNTTSTISLTNNTITNSDSSGKFLRAQADSWGSSGSNGGAVTLLLTNQKAVGNIVIDEVSTLDMTMSDGSFYEGTINGDNTAKALTLKLDKTSGIKLTGDSYITSFDNEDTTNSNIDFNGYKLYVNGKAVN